MSVAEFIVDPRGLEFGRWAALAAEQLQEYDVAMPGDSWQDWAFNLFNSPQLETFGLPDPRMYAGWQPWAEELTLALNS